MVNYQITNFRVEMVISQRNKTESIKDFKEGIRAVKQANIGIQSITIDGKRGYIR